MKSTVFGRIAGLPGWTALFVAGLLAPAPLAAQQSETPPRTVSVTGTGTVERAPERAVIMLAVETEAPAAQAASQANAQSMERVLGALRGAGIAAADIRTVSYRIEPIYAPQTREQTEPRITGYRAINMVRVQVDALDRLGQIIDTAIQAGANRVANLSFELRDWEAARTAALELAVASAQRQAAALARAAGQQLGEPLTISADMIGPPRPVPYAMAARAELAQASTPIETGTITVEVNVNVVYRLQSS